MARISGVYGTISYRCVTCLFDTFSFFLPRLEWLELKKEYKNLQREAMNNLKKQLHEKSSADSSQTGSQTRKQSQGQVDASKKKNQSKSSQEESQTVKELPYTPGVVIKFNCQSHGMTKKELRVRKMLQLCDVFLSFNDLLSFSNV